MTERGSGSLDRLLDRLSAAVLAVYGADGDIVLSPVWFRVAGDAVEVVVAEGDPKLTALRHDPRCVFLAFEAVVPFAGLQIRADATLLMESVHAARAEIASRYLGPRGRRAMDRSAHEAGRHRAPAPVRGENLGSRAYSPRGGTGQRATSNSPNQ